LGVGFVVSRRSLVVGRQYEEQNQTDDRRLTTDDF